MDGDAGIPNAPLTLAEANAHFIIVNALDQLAAAKDRAMDVREIRRAESAALHRVHEPLLAFRARCNCGGLVAFSPRRLGARVARCERCDRKWIECALEFGARP